MRVCLAGSALALEGPTLLLSPPLVSDVTTTSPLRKFVSDVAAIWRAERGCERTEGGG